MIVAGIDEAGYGPLLGPLVVSATAFEMDHHSLPASPADIPCIWTLLKAAVAKKAPATKGRLLITDSKIVHNLTDGDKLLERGVLAFLRNYQQSSTAWEEFHAENLLHSLDCTNHELLAHPWYSPSAIRVPWKADGGDLAISCNMLANALRVAKVAPVCMRTAVVSEKLFNRMVSGTNNKASTLVSITLSHLHYLYTHFSHKGLVVGIDKQGGRDHYTSLLLNTFPEAQLKVVSEGPKASTYLLTEQNGSETRQAMICFREKGDSAFFPTALASMICKYLRELCMHSFNTWWCNHITDLRPTAGYYQDGTRWLADVEPHLARLGIRREMLIRIK